MRRSLVGTPPATRILHLVADAIGAPLPIRLRAWDGSEAGPDGGPTLVVHNRRALRHVMWAPGHLGLARAYVSGDLDVEGDMFTFMEAFLRPAWRAAPPRPSALMWWRLARTAAGLGALGPRPPLPPEEMSQRAGGRHTKSRDAAAVSHHYDVSNDFYRVILGETMVYSCAYFADSGGQELAESRLDDAQQAKLDLICRKLGLRPGQRLLDVGCGWGSLALHAALKYGVQVVGVTLSQAQAEFARQRVRESGMEQLVDIRLQDYRDVDDGPYDAISSVGMAEHVGRRQFLTYAQRLHELLRPGGRLLNHMIATHEDEHAANPFFEAYVFPDGELIPLGETVTALESAGLEVRDVHVLREHYVLTLRHWLERLERGWSDAVTASSEGRARVWRVYMAASALGFQQRRLGVNQVLAVRPTDHAGSGMPLLPVER